MMPFNAMKLAADSVVWSTASLLHFNGANNSTVFTDQNGRTWTANGTAKISTAQSQFGGASGLLDGTASCHVTTPNTADFQFGSGNFTIEAFIRPTSNVDGTIVANWRGVSATDCAWIFYRASNGKLTFSYGVGGVNLGLASTGTIALNIWTHVAVVRNGTSLMLFIGGVLDSSFSLVGSLNYFAVEPIVIGAISVAATGSGSNRYVGYIDELRITKGLARYTSSFTPPTAEFPYP